VMAYCAQLQKDFGVFREDFNMIGKHLGHARNKFADAEKRLDRFETKLEQATDSPELEAAEVAELPRALDAA
jgi:DNA recombination protein RmuC